MRPRYFWLCVFLGCLFGAAMVYFHVGPGITPALPKDTAAYRNSLRSSYINQIADGLKGYYHAYKSWPIQMPTSSTQICTSDGASCASRHLVDLSFLTTGGNFIIGIPHDPNGGFGQWGSGFFITQQDNGNIQLTAPEAEAGRTISRTITP